MQSYTLETGEFARYNRHLNLPGFTSVHQIRLKHAKVLIVGAGGLGTPLIQYLAAAGVGNIGIIDDDLIEISNLQRQVIYKTKDIGKSKSEMAGQFINDLNPEIKVNIHAVKLDRNNALEILKPYDIIADGTDNFPTRYLVNDACIFLDKINVHASVFRFEGQVSVFNFPSTTSKRSPNYRDLFPEPPTEQVLSCAEGGILGVLPGILGSFQALEIIKVITGLGNPLISKLFIFDALTMQTNTIKYSHNPDNPLTGKNPVIHELINYEEFCNGLRTIEGISVETLKDWKDQNLRNFQLVDVREKEEYMIANIGGESIPLSTLQSAISLINTEKKVVVHCKSGARSKKAISILTNKYGFKNLLNLEGGIDAWHKKFGF